WSRRLLISRGWGVTLAGLVFPRTLRGQAAAAPPETVDGFRGLRAKGGTAAFRGGAAGLTGGWGVDGAGRGAALRVKRGEQLKLRVINELPEPTSIHWHGLR